MIVLFDPRLSIAQKQSRDSGRKRSKVPSRISLDLASELNNFSRLLRRFPSRTLTTWDASSASTVSKSGRARTLQTVEQVGRVSSGNEDSAALLRGHDLPCRDSTVLLDSRERRSGHRRQRITDRHFGLNEETLRLTAKAPLDRRGSTRSSSTLREEGKHRGLPSRDLHVTRRRRRRDVLGIRCDCVVSPCHRPRVRAQTRAPWGLCLRGKRGGECVVNEREG